MQDQNSSDQIRSDQQIALTSQLLKFKIFLNAGLDTDMAKNYFNLLMLQYHCHGLNF